MTRSINSNHPVVSSAVAPDPKTELLEWLAAQAAALGPAWLLAHADDGVVWGRWTQGGGLITSHDAAQGHSVAATVCPPLRWKTLQQARLFTVGGELLVWRDDDGKYAARLLADALPDGAAWTESFDEAVFLLGTHSQSLSHDFTLLEDGAQGLRHAVPLSLPSVIPPDDPPRLLIRHYLADESLARVAVSRLCGLTWKGAAVVPA